MKRKNKMYCGTYGLFMGFKASLSIWLRWAKEIFGKGRMVYFRNNSCRHRRSFICCELPKIVGNRVIYRLLKATKWFKEPNVKYGRKDENEILSTRILR